MRPTLSSGSRISALALTATKRSLSESYRECRYHLRRQTPTVPSSRPGTRPTRTCTTCYSSRRKVQHASSSAACRQHTQRGLRTRTTPVGRPSQKVRRLFDGDAQSGARQHEFRANEFGPTPRRIPYKLDTRRERLNARNPLEETIDRQFGDIIIQALPPEYECIRTPYLEKPDFWIADIYRMMSAIYAANHARSSSSTSIAGHVAAMPATKNNGRDIIFSYCERADHFKKTCLYRAKHEQQRQQREQRNEQQNQQQCGRCQRGRQRRGKTSRQPPSYRERWCSYRSTTNHSEADCRAVRTQTATPTYPSLNTPACRESAATRDIPDSKESSERPSISFFATEVTSSAATITSKQEKGTGCLARHRRRALGRLSIVKSRSSTFEGSRNTIRHTCSTPTARGGRSTVRP